MRPWLALCLSAGLLAACGGSATDSGNGGSLTITATRSLIAAGDSLPLNVVVVNASGDTLPFTPAEMKWTSSDPAVFTIARDGTLHGVGEGTAHATASNGGLSGTVQVGVLEPVPSFLAYASPAGEYVGQGKTVHLDVAPELWQRGATGSTGAGVSHIYLIVSEWFLDIAAPQGQVLGERNFPNATRFPFQSPSEPGLDFSGEGRGCNSLTGSFTILDLELEDASRIARLHFKFTQACEGNDPPLTGEVQLFGLSPVEWPEPAAR